MNLNITGLSFNILPEINQDYDNKLSTIERENMKTHERKVNGEMEKSQRQMNELNFGERE